MQTYDAVDLFAGPGGWDVAARRLGLKVLGIEFDATAVATRRAAGHPTCHGDVRDFGPLTVAAEGLIASPPCQTFSMAGKGAGRAALDTVEALARAMARREEIDFSRFDDPRTALVLEPLRWALEAIDLGRPYRWLAFEQVPTVRPVWEILAELLRAEGYAVEVGNLQAEQYGVPQTRKRAFLVARFGESVALPEPTHSRYYARSPEKLDAGVLPWRSLAFGLGVRQRDPLPAPNGGDTSWIYRRPSPTIVGSFRPDIIAAPGYRKAGDPPRQKTPGSVQVTLSQAAALQSFPPDYPWQGNEGQQFLQVGNAVPPLLAEAVLAAVIRKVDA